MRENGNHMLGHTLLRVTIGILFLMAGINKLTGGADKVSGFLGSLGFPVPILFAWILILGEIIFGALVLIGYKVKYTAWPLAIILFIAWIIATIPSSGIGSTNSLFHIITVAALITIALTGPGKWALTRD